MSNHEATAMPLPPRGRKFASPEAEVIWAAIERLDEGLKHEVLHHLRFHLGAPEDRVGQDGIRIARATAALREAWTLELTEHGLSPTDPETREIKLTPEAYERHRAAKPEAQWPPVRSVRRWLGGDWATALSRAALPVTNHGDALVARLGHKFTHAEMTQAIRDCSTDLGAIPSFGSYIAWSKRPDVLRRPGRRPRSQAPFYERYGSWANALAAAGLITTKTPGRVVIDGSLRPAGYRYSEEQLVETLREAAKALGGSPRTTAFKRWREETIQESLAEGHQRAIPDYGTYLKVYDTWDGALAGAGLPTLGGKATAKYGSIRKDANARIPEEYLRKVLRMAYADVGEPFTTAAYEAWRAERKARDAEKGLKERYPIWMTYRKRYGSWPNAKKALLEDE